MESVPGIKNLLATTRLNYYLTSGEIDTISSYGEMVTFKEGQVIIHQGQKSKGFYIIITGEVLTLAKVLGEGIAELRVLGHGNFIGEVSVISGQPCFTSFLAKNNVECLFVRKKYFEMLSVFSPTIKYGILQAIMDDSKEKIINIYHKISKVMTESDMVSQSFFGEVVKSLLNPTAITFKEADIHLGSLKKTAMFERFTEEEFDILIKNSQLLQVPKNCNLIKKAEKNISCFIVLKGCIQSSIVKENKVAKFAVFGPVSFINTLPVIDENALTIFNYTACENAIVLHLNEKNIMFIKNNVLSLWYKMYDLISFSFGKLERQATQLEIRLRGESYNR